MPACASVLVLRCGVVEVCIGLAAYDRMVVGQGERGRGVARP